MSFLKINDYKLNFIIAIIVCFTVLFNTSSAAEPLLDTGNSESRAVLPQAEWTVMIYGSLDAEKTMTDGLGAELLTLLKATEGQAHYNALAQIDFSGSKEPAIRFARTSNGKTAAEKKGNPNMGSPETLDDFLQWGTSFPAKNRMLVVYGHGTGWLSTRGNGSIFDTAKQSNSRSFAYDYSNDDCLTLDESGKIFARYNGDRKINILAMRSCIMNSAEVLHELYPHFNYLILAESMQYFMLPYTKAGKVTYKPDVRFLKSLKPAMSSYEAAIALTKSMAGTNHRVLQKDPKARVNFQLSLWDCAALNDFPVALKDFTDRFVSLNLSLYRKRQLLHESRKKCPAYYGTAGTVNNEKVRDIVDFPVFLKNLQKIAVNQYALKYPDALEELMSLAETAEVLNSVLQDASLAAWDNRASKTQVKLTNTPATGIFLPYPARGLIIAYKSHFRKSYSRLKLSTETGFDKVVDINFGIQE